MIRIAMIRHAPTVWNEEGRIQGRTQTALSEAGKTMARSWRLPTELIDIRWVTSTLDRTQQTAHLMGLDQTAADPRLDEMDWGAWTGRTLAELRAEEGDAMAANEARGLDFRPPGGESPRDVQHRLDNWFREVAAEGNDIGAITHRGVQRAAIGLATGWNFLGKPPFKLARDGILLLEVDANGTPRLGNIGLTLGPA